MVSAIFQATMPSQTLPKTYHIQTYGCAMNYSDAERLETVLNRLGLKKERTMKNSDIVIFNTCSVRKHAEDRAMGSLKKINAWKQLKPNLLVGFTGCMVRTSSTRNSHEKDTLLKKLQGLDFAFRIEDSANFPSFIQELNPRFNVPEISEAELSNYFLINPESKSKAQVLIPIGTGCDKYCFYCIVPYARGRERSRDMDEIVKEAELAVENGAVEITLIGQTVNSYGLSASDRSSKRFDYSPPPFIQLLAKLNSFYDKGLRRVRFTSPYIPDVSDELIEAMATLKTLQPYIHLPIQAGDNRTLKHMNRKYTIEEYRQKIQKIRKCIPEIAISTDIIVGYCGETDEEFENTYKLFEEIRWDHAYLAQYSVRKGTFAAKNYKDNVPAHIKAMRWHRLNTLLGKISKEKHSKFVGKTVNVLVESKKDDYCVGRSEHFKTVQFKAGRNLIGKIVPVRVIKSYEWVLEGELLPTYFF